MLNQEKFVDVLTNLGHSSSLHGITKIVSSRQIAVKVLWSILLISACALFTVQLVGLSLEFFSYPIKTTVSLKFSSLRFPAVTFCNMNPVKHSKVPAEGELVDILTGAAGRGSAANSVRKTATTTDPGAVKDTNNMTTAKDGTGDVSVSENVTTATTSKVGDDWIKAAPINISNASVWDIFDDIVMNGAGEHVFNSSADNVSLEQLKSNVNGFDEWRLRVLAAFKKIPPAERFQMGHQVEDLVHSASFAGFLIGPGVFPYAITTNHEYGNCFTLDNDVLMSTSSGPASGLKLVLNLEVPEYIKQFTTGFGIRLVIHQPGTYPLPGREGITLNPGFETNIGLKSVKIDRLGDKYGVCEDRNLIAGLEHIQYTVPFCYAACEYQHIISQCGCFPYDAPDLLNSPLRICGTELLSIDAVCQEKVLADIQDELLECHCSTRCHENVYETFISGRNWPHDEYMKQVLLKKSCDKNITSMQGMCLELNSSNKVSPDVFGNFLRVNIYYQDLNYEYIKEEPLYTFISFLSDIGGALGLFLGASVLTFVELLQLILEVVLYFHHKRVGKNYVINNREVADK